MAKSRVHEIASDYGIESRVVLDKLKEIGEFVKGPSSNVEPPVERKVRAALEEDGHKVKSAEPEEKPKETSASKSPSAAPSESKTKKPTPAAKSAAKKPATPAAPSPADFAPKPARPAAPEKPAAEPKEQSPAIPRLPKAPTPNEIPKPNAIPRPPRPRAPRPGNNPYASAQGMQRQPRPGNNPYSSAQGMGGRPGPGQRGGGPRPQGQGGPGQRPGGPRPGQQQGGPRQQRPQAPGTAPVSPFPPQPGAGGAPGGGGPGRGRGRGNQPGSTAGAFGRGTGGRSKARKSKRMKRQEFELREAPSLGGVTVPRGTGDTVVQLRRGASITDFAEKIDASPANIVTVLFHLGEMATATESLDDDTFQVLGEELGYKIQIVSPEDEDRELLDAFDIDLEAELAEETDEDLLPRPPVVTVMGHVDHGKTRLLDRIRKSDVGDSEAGGITQHIGAYQVQTTHEGKKRAITFIDTPGHEAFTAMRARGAQVTDVAILVVAADDGIMPQTIEAINHSKAANVPIVVAVNKVDKDTARPDRVRQQLTEYDLIAEEYGGDVMFMDVSAATGQGITELLDAVLLTADAALELRANPDKAARGTAIEANLDKGRGAVATVLVQSGTMKVGDAVVAGTAYGRVRAMFDENGDNVEEAGPSRPVQVLGFTSVPRAGDSLLVTDDDRTARQIAEKREAAERNALLARSRKRISLEDFTKVLEEGKVESLNLIIKGDVSGAVEALEESLLKIDVDDSVALRIIHRGVGAVTESDVNLATIDNAIIIGFNVRPDAKARERAAREGVDVRFYSVIYQALEDIENSLKGLLKPEYEEVQSGVAEIREIFRSSKFGNIAGSIVRSGTITRNAKARVIRNGVVVGDNLAIESLRRFKDDVSEVRTDYECGIGLGKFNDLQVGDEIETTELVEKPR